MPGPDRPSSAASSREWLFAVVDARLGTPIPRATLCVEGEGQAVGDLIGHILWTGPSAARKRAWVFKTGFEALEFALPADPPERNHPFLLKLEHGEGRSIPVFFNVHSPRRASFADPIESVFIYGEFSDWNSKQHSLRPRPHVQDIWEGRAELPETAGASDCHFMLNGHRREEDPDEPLAGTSVGWVAHVRARTRAVPEMAFLRPAEGDVVPLGRLECEAVFAPAQGEGSELDAASVQLEVNGRLVQPENLQIEGHRLRFALYLEGRGERSLIVMARDRAGRLGRGFGSVFATAGETDHRPVGKWIDPAPAPAPEAPAWMAEAIFYQAHTRVFHPLNGGPGTFQSLIEKLDYIADLGANVLQMMPLFDGPNSHGYENYSYFRVDRDLGTGADFAALVQAAHQRGLRVLLDYSDTATQTCHPLFRRAALEVDHPLRDLIHWIGGDTYSSYTVKRDTLNGHWPQFDFANPRACEYMAEMIVHWMRDCGVDGFRLDSVERVKPFPSHDWWKILRREVKAVRPDALLWGEVFHNQAAFFEDQLDAAYDTGFNNALREGLIQEDARVIVKAAQASAQMDPSGLRLIRFLSNHDTDRILTSLQGKRAKLPTAFAILLTFPGVPYLYYGEEVGMTGQGVGRGNTNRRPMVWEGGDTALQAEVRRLARLRRAHPVLANAGDCEFLPVKSPRHILAWRRASKDRREEYFAFANLSDKLRVAKLDQPARDALSRWNRLRDVFADPDAPAENSRQICRKGLSLEAHSYRIFRGEEPAAK